MRIWEHKLREGEAYAHSDNESSKIKWNSYIMTVMTQLLIIVLNLLALNQLFKVSGDDMLRYFYLQGRTLRVCNNSIFFDIWCINFKFQNMDLNYKFRINLWVTNHESTYLLRGTKKKKKRTCGVFSCSFNNTCHL